MGAALEGNLEGRIYRVLAQTAGTKPAGMVQRDRWISAEISHLESLATFPGGLTKIRNIGQWFKHEMCMRLFRETELHTHSVHTTYKH
jgi:hypothetical protein